MAEPVDVRFKSIGSHALVLHAEHTGGKNSWERLHTLSDQLATEVAKLGKAPTIVFLDLINPVAAAAAPPGMGPDGRAHRAEARVLVLLSPVPLSRDKRLEADDAALRERANERLSQVVEQLAGTSADQLLVLSPTAKQAEVRELSTARGQVIGHEIIFPAKDFFVPPPSWPVATWRKATSWFGTRAARNRSPKTLPTTLLGGKLQSKSLSRYTDGATVEFCVAASDKPLRAPVLHVYFKFNGKLRDIELKPWIDAPPEPTPARNGALLQRLPRQDGAEDIMERCLHATGSERVQAVVDFEVEHVNNRRADRKAHIKDTPASTVDGLTGLALSGGGIRSSTVSIGFMRGLQDVRALESFDYASSVSGGSYANGYLQVMTSEPVLAQLGVKLGTDNPFTTAFDDQSVAALLQGGRYLAMGTGLRGVFNVLRFLTNYVTALLQHWLWIVSVLITLGLGLRFFTPWLRPLAGGFGTLAVLFLVFRSIALRDYSRFKRSASRTIDNGTNRIETFVWSLLILSAGALLIERVPSWFAALGRHLQSTMSALPCPSPLWTVLLTLGLVCAYFVFNRPADARSDGRRTAAALITGVAALTVGAWQLASVCNVADAHAVGQRFFACYEAINRCHLARLALMILVTFVLTLITSPNNTSLYRYYSARLSDAFLRGVNRITPSDSKSVAPSAQQAQSRESARLLREEKAKQQLVFLRNLTQRKNLGPYPLFNGCVNLMGADDTKFVGLRTADYFVLAPHHCGAKLTGYAPTKEGKQYGHLTLADAITVSGAAISPFQGRTMPSAISIVLWLLNLRTDAWLPNPSHPRTGLWRRLMGDASVIWGPVQQLAALFGQLTTRSRFLNVADGAFIDNLGLYELLRRRCRMIVVLDATLDPEYDFHELRNVVLRARQELGIEFSFDEEPEIAIKPKSGDGGSDKGVVKALIRYPKLEHAAGTTTGPEQGILFYVKSALSKAVVDEGPTELTGQNAADVSRAYRTYYPEFPQESTGDQFFDAVQWDAYYALGRALAAELVAHPSWKQRK